jgi:hypothetical protein
MGHEEPVLTGVESDDSVIRECLVDLSDDPLGEHGRLI